MTDRLRIGDIARETGRSVHAIRWYERQGLVPHVERDAGGRRAYRRGHVEWLRLLDRLRFTGMSIKTIRRYAELVTSRAPLGKQHELLRSHRADVEGRIDELRAALDLIDRKIAFYREWEDSGKRPSWSPASRGQE